MGLGLDRVLLTLLLVLGQFRVAKQGVVVDVELGVGRDDPTVTVTISGLISASEASESTKTR